MHQKTNARLGARPARSDHRCALAIRYAGFAAWLLAKRPGREIRAGALPYLLTKNGGPGEHIGRDKVRRFFRELKAAGYVQNRDALQGSRKPVCANTCSRAASRNSSPGLGSSNRPGDHHRAHAQRHQRECALSSFRFGCAPPSWEPPGFDATSALRRKTKQSGP